MAAGAPGAAAGKTPLAGVVLGRETAHVTQTPAGGDPRPLAPPARAGADAARETENATASEVRARGAGGTSGADSKDPRNDFSTALDKARLPAQARSAAQQAAETKAVSGGAEAATVAVRMTGQLAGEPGGVHASPPDKPADGKPKVDEMVADDPLSAASAGVVALLGWLQPALPASSRDSPGGGDQGGSEDRGGEGDDLGVVGPCPAGGTSGITANLATSTGAQNTVLPAAQPSSTTGSDSTMKGLAADAAPASVQPGDAGPTAGANGGNAQAAGFEAGQFLRASATVLAAPVEHSVPVPMGDRHWARALSTQVLLLANHKVESATLRLSPEHTGPIEVRIQLQDSGVNLAFNASQADTRAALEQALPQLRAAFADAGLALGQATVGQQMRQGSQFLQRPHHAADVTADHPEATAAVMRPVGLVDEYV